MIFSLVTYLLSCVYLQSHLLTSSIVCVFIVTLCLIVNKCRIDELLLLLIIFKGNLFDLFSLDDFDNRNGTLQEHLKKIPCLMQQLTGDRENLKTKNALLVQFVRGLSHDLNDCQGGQKKYKVNYF